MRIKSYSDYLSRISGLIGIPVNGFNADELTMLNGYFQTNIEEAWQRTSWIDLCPYGEARFVGNKLTYPNDLTKTAFWTTTNATATANSVPNPADGRITASRLLETTANGSHFVEQPVTQFIPGVTYQLSGSSRYIGRTFIRVAVNDGGTVFSAFFNLLTGAVGTTSGLTGYSMAQVNDGFWFWTINFTAGTTAGVGSITIRTSTDGSTTSFVGDPTKGFFSWGVVLQQTSLTGAENMLLAWDQPGEEVIEAVFEVWRTSPKNAMTPWRQPYELTPDGLQMLGPDGSWVGGYFSPPVTATTIYSNMPPNPVFVYYRKQVPEFQGEDYDQTAIYSVGDQIFFEDENDTENFWRCLAGTAPGQSPDTMPASWGLLVIPDFIFRAAVFGSYADWLRQDGQFEKAQVADQNADQQLQGEFDRMERQMGQMQPMRVQTHLTSRAGLF